MPRRNLLVLFLVALVAILCRQRVQHNPYTGVLASAMNTIEKRSLDPVGDKVLFEGAMDGMLRQLDDYSAYLSPKDMTAFHETVDLQFAGVGIEVAIDPKTKQLEVLSPVANSPASKAGILAGDNILRIGETSTLRMSLHDASLLLRGKSGEPVTLSILHKGAAKPENVTLVREVIQVESVLGDTRNPNGTWNFFLDGHDRIGYVRISCFTDDTPNELKQAIEWMIERGMRGLVIDLRDDPGGYLSAAVAICDLFIKSGEIVTTRGRQGTICTGYSASGDAPFTDFPIAVVVNQETASAAEIVAACLQDQHRAVVVGQRTYGKGTVQELIVLDRGCGEMKLTTKSYWRPSGKDIRRPHRVTSKDDWGVSPDEGFKVRLSKEELDRWQQWRNRRDLHKPLPGETPEKKNAKPFVDRQRERAVEYVEKEAERRESGTATGK
jgi:carboxyl-terminal processing protease